MLAAGLALTGCASVLQGSPTAGGSGSGSTSYDHATGPQDVLVSIDVAGGFVPVEVNLRNTAQFLLLGDGTTIAAGPVTAIYPGPALYPLLFSMLNEGRIQALFAAADDAGLLDGEIDYGQPGVTDLPNTTVQIVVDGVASWQSAYALGFDDDASPDLSAAERGARRDLREFIDTAQALVGQDGQDYAPTGVVAYRLSAVSAPPADDPQLEQEPRPWPIATVPPPTGPDEVASCAVVTGPEVPTLLAALAGANELTLWLIGADEPVRMAFRPFLPGDPGCTE